MTNAKEFILKKYREIGLVIIAVIYLLTYLGAKTPFWAGKATVFSAGILLLVALFDLVKKNGVEKS